MSNFRTKDYRRIGLSHGNWRKMSGMDQGPFPSRQPSSGIAPPTMSQEFSSAKSQLAAIPGAFTQALYGNFDKAEQMMAPSYAAQPVQPSAATPPAMAIEPVLQPQAPVIDNSYNYEAGIETSLVDPATVNEDLVGDSSDTMALFNDGSAMMPMFG